MPDVLLVTVTVKVAGELPDVPFPDVLPEMLFDVTVTVAGELLPHVMVAVSGGVVLF